MAPETLCKASKIERGDVLRGPCLPCKIQAFSNWPRMKKTNVEMLKPKRD